MIDAVIDALGILSVVTTGLTTLATSAVPMTVPSDAGIISIGGPGYNAWCEGTSRNCGWRGVVNEVRIYAGAHDVATRQGIRAELVSRWHLQ